ncbi:PD-(D/E)XK nuclease family protein [Enterococcus faecalis]|nr:PD-(D/E)XK nuclease family protein [Enterococcus faecalis]
MSYPKPYFSYSQIKSYLTCPQAFYQSYIKGIRDPGNKYSAAGNVFHTVAEKFPVPKRSDLPAIKKLFVTEFKKIPVEYFEDSYERQEFFDKGIRMIQNYIRVYGDADEPLFVERKMHARVIDDLPPALSYIDRIDGDLDDPSTYIITDYKTSNNAWAKSKLKDEFQLGLYALQAKAVFGEWPAVVQYYFPAPDKFVIAIHQGDGIYRYQNQRAPVLEINPADVAYTIRQAIADISAGKFEDTTGDSYFCRTWCWHHKNGLTEGPVIKQEGWGSV